MYNDELTNAITFVLFNISNFFFFFNIWLRFAIDILQKILKYWKLREFLSLLYNFRKLKNQNCKNLVNVVF